MANSVNGHLALVVLVVSSALFLHHLPQITAVPIPPPTKSNASDYIRTSCNVTLYPDLCYSTLSSYANTIHLSPRYLASLAVNLSLAEAKRADLYVRNITPHLSGFDPRTVAALGDCVSCYDAAVYQIKRSLRQLKRLKARDVEFRFEMSNVKTWMSAALTYEGTCVDGFELVSGGALKNDVTYRADKLKKFTSNALALVNSFADGV
ncbi:hypothetical protein Sjap_014737 [Stephania japonica]|uniref:Pectinesterase inhibitor domain-containing protein n=1 Tax=Stephania japonica TaxID=461633 RepID=A0AAP0IIB0_9MAGN